MTLQLPLAYPDAEQVGLAIVSLIGVENDTWLPSPLTPPFVQVQRTGGTPDQWDVTDYPVLTLSCWGGDRNGAWELARDVERYFLAHRGKVVDVPDVGEVLIDFVETVAGQEQLPDLEPDDRKVVISVRLGMRRQYHLAP